MTLACLDSLRLQGRCEGAQVQVFLVDDGSTDGTGEAVAREFADVLLIAGDGQLFWSGGMRLALQHARQWDPDFYFWVNDDVVLDNFALDILLRTQQNLLSAQGSAAIVVGSMRDPETGVLTYGGVRRRRRLRPLRFEVVPPRTHPVPCETMNGNAVLVPREVVSKVGNIDAAYWHSMGDFDYGLRAREANCSVWVAPGTVGTCASNPLPAPGSERLGDELRRMRGLKGLPPSPWRTFARRWAGPLWPIYFVSPYVRRFGRSTRARLPWLPGRKGQSRGRVDAG